MYEGRASGRGLRLIHKVATRCASWPGRPDSDAVFSSPSPSRQRGLRPLGGRRYDESLARSRAGEIDTPHAGPGGETKALHPNQPDIHARNFRPISLRRGEEKERRACDVCLAERVGECLGDGEGKGVCVWDGQLLRKLGELSFSL